MGLSDQVSARPIYLPYSELKAEPFKGQSVPEATRV